jgi:hypothetical protein
MTTHKKIECRRCGCLVESVSGDSEGVGEYLPQGWKFTQTPAEELAGPLGKPTCPNCIGSDGLINDRVDRRKLYHD